ncbi:MAG: serine/threonine protein kinase [Gemmataceae bacterium]
MSAVLHQGLPAMRVGQKVGPFLIEKELGAGAMGAVYRGKYLKTGALVAIKVMAPGLGTSNPNAMARFEREANILKQLKHPNIVRYYGSGKYHGTPFYAMEYIQGESLDKTMARRDRMTWEQVVDLGRQLCGALQHAHDAGIVHRDLKPSNLMMLPDGTVKLTDFGIAKDLDVTQLTGANCAIGTAAYMSPEQCKGDPNITNKSDLYSLGIVFYELITGRKPFGAENAMEMFLLHCNGKFDRPSKSVPELPVWMDTLICHLMEKKPDQRPMNAAMVGEVLGAIQEKVEAQASAGLDVALARRGESPTERHDMSQEDRDATRSLLGKKGVRRKKKKDEGGEKKVPAWVQAVGLLGLLAAVAVLLFVAFQPPAAQALHDRAEALVKAGKLAEAVDGPVADYLRIYGRQDTPLTAAVRRWRDEHDVSLLHGFMDKHVRHAVEGKGLAVDAQNDRERLAFKAALAEYHGDRATAEAVWRELESGGDNVAAVARYHARMLAGLAKEDERMAGLRMQARERRGEVELDGLTREAFTAWRQEQFGDRLGAAKRYEALRDEARKDVGGRYWALFAAARGRALREGLKQKPQDDDGRVQAVAEAVRAAADGLKASGTSLLSLRVTFHDAVLLYDKDPALAEAVKQARAGIKYVDERVK